MEPIKQLKRLGLLKPEMDILDIGCRNGWLFERLKKPGRNYDAVDIYDNLPDKTGMRFFQESFTTFVPDKKYDLIFAKDVFFCEPNQIEHAIRYLDYLKPDGVFFVSFMLEDDPHVGMRAIDDTFWYGVSQDKIDFFMQQGDILWKEDFQGEAPTFSGKMRQWHVYSIIFKKK